MKLFSGTSNLPLSQKISALCQPLSEVVLKKFADGESFAQLMHSARGEHAVLIQSISAPVNDNLMEALVVIDALKRNGAKRITLVAPYLGYSRQDRRVGTTRTPITAKLVADTLTAAGMNQLITVDVHNLAIEGFYNIPFMNVTTSNLFAEDIRANFPDLESAIIVSPDAGGVGRARQVAKELDLDVAIIDKRREKANQVESMRLIGDVAGKDAILIDDIADTCRTMLKSVNLLCEKGAKSVQIYVSHGIFSEDALEVIDNSAIRELVVTDSIVNEKADKVSKIRRVSVAPMIIEIIMRAIN